MHTESAVSWEFGRTARQWRRRVAPRMVEVHFGQAPPCGRVAREELWRAGGDRADTRPTGSGQLRPRMQLVCCRHVPDISWLVLNCYQAGRLNGDCPIAIGAGQGMSVTPLAPKKMTGGRGKFSQAMKASPELVTHKTNGRSPLAAG